MTTKAIEQTLMSFYNHECDVLLCTTIVENGLDIPNVNTIIMDRAEQLGLSQIHQLRGRVGRSEKRYAYILFSQDKVLKETAISRLRAISMYHWALGMI